MVSSRPAPTITQGLPGGDWREATQEALRAYPITEPGSPLTPLPRSRNNGRAPWRDQVYHKAKEARRDHTIEASKRLPPPRTISEI